jgi:hypothetical protein
MMQDDGRDVPVPGEEPSDDPVGSAADTPGSPAESYVVLTADPQTGDLDAYGPLTGVDAVVEAGRRRDEFDAADLGDVMIGVVPLHRLSR